MNSENCRCCIGTKNSDSSAIYVSISFDIPIACANELATRMKMPSWRALWRRIKKERKRIFNSSPTILVPYDLNSYSKNFDDGHYSTDPDNVWRSFSARYAMPSKILQESEGVS